MIFNLNFEFWRHYFVNLKNETYLQDLQPLFKMQFTNDSFKLALAHENDFPLPAF